jgi:nucleolar complex protein 3
MSKSRPLKRRRISPPTENTTLGNTSPEPAQSSVKHSFLKHAAQWNLEQDYETRPRKLREKGKEKREKLMIKNAEGWIQPEAESDEEDVDGSDDGSEFEGLDSDVPTQGHHDGDGPAADSENGQGTEAQKPKIPVRLQIINAKEELARIASLINEDPEENIGRLKALSELAESENNTVHKLALVTQLSVYKDLIPGYRIRPHIDENKTEKVSKEVRKLRAYEQALVSGYQNYIRSLATQAKQSGARSSEDAASLASVAISCACALLTSVPHFNFRSELIKILVDKCSTKNVDKDYEKCVEALQTLFRNDEDGNASLDAVGLITKMIKARDYRIDESILNTFLSLRLLSELAVKASHQRVDAAGEQSAVKRKFKKEFRTKRERKLIRENKALEKEFKEADASVSHEERDKNQSETLKLVFVTYFRILKERVPSLMGAVLEGLAKYAHLINQDFFGDILEALKDLIHEAEAAEADDKDNLSSSTSSSENSVTRNPTRSSLLCIITAFALLQGQDASVAASTLHLDLTFFINRLYNTLIPISLNPDIELSAKSLHLPDPQRNNAHKPTDEDTNPAAPSQHKPKINIQTTTVLLIRSLTSTLLPKARLHTLPPSHVAKFAKLLYTSSLQLPEKSALAMLGLLTLVVKTHRTKVAGLWSSEERRGDGVWDAESGQNPFAATMWEGEVLKCHYAPDVRAAVEGVEAAVESGGR